jgi:hypothetical protein
MGHRGAVWDERLSELADYRKIHGLQCSSNSKRTKLGRWVKSKGQYKLHQGRKKSYDRLPNSEVGGFSNGNLRRLGRRLKELADYRKIQALQCS